jgi:hypothetical protein
VENRDFRFRIPLANFNNASAVVGVDKIDLSIAWNSFTASDPPPRSTRLVVAPSDLQPRPQPGVGAQPNARAPMRSSRQSIASSHSSKRSSALVQRFSSLPELVGALE